MTATTFHPSGPGWSVGAAARIEAAWNSQPIPGLPTPQTLVEAVMHAVRERGLAALKEPATKERLDRCDERAKAQINGRIAKLTGLVEASDAAA